MRLFSGQINRLEDRLVSTERNLEESLGVVKQQCEKIESTLNMLVMSLSFKREDTIALEDLEMER